MGYSRQEHWSGLPFPSPVRESEKWKWSRAVVSDSYRPHGLATHYKFRMKITRSSSHTELLSVSVVTIIFPPPSLACCVLCTGCASLPISSPLNPFAVLQGPFHALKSSRSFWTSSWSVVCSAFCELPGISLTIPQFLQQTYVGTDIISLLDCKLMDAGALCESSSNFPQHLVQCLEVTGTQ